MEDEKENMIQTAIVLGVVLYFLVLGLMWAFGWNNWPIILPGSTLLSAALAWYYFTLDSPSALNGLYLGLVFLIVGACLDVLIFVLYKKETEMLISVYTTPMFIGGLLLYMLAPALVGWYLS